LVEPEFWQDYHVFEWDCDAWGSMAAVKAIDEFRGLVHDFPGILPDMVSQDWLKVDIDGLRNRVTDRIAALVNHRRVEVRREFGPTCSWKSGVVVTEAIGRLRWWTIWTSRVEPERMDPFLTLWVTVISNSLRNCNRWALMTFNFAARPQRSKFVPG
jgi:hypothetical protein